MADTKKKTSKRRLKRSIRKTLGALFLASAIAVAAIPVDNFGTRAAGEQPETLKVTADTSKIPRVDITKPYNIYTTADGAFQFAYLSDNDVASNNRYAVILGYAGGKLDQYGTLTIPDEVDAYLKYSYSQGSNYGYCAVGKSGNFLYYRTTEVEKDDFGNDVYEIVYEKDAEGEFILDENGKKKPITKKDADGNDLKDENGQLVYLQQLKYKFTYKPCYNTDYENWKNLGEEEFFYNAAEILGNPRDESQYYRTDNSHAEYQRIKQATVRYIGNQYLIASATNEGTWEVAPEDVGPNTGIFRGEVAGNVTTLKVGEHLTGIGNYAFYKCTNLQGIELNNGLDTIGNHAFEECINMKKVDIQLNAMITTIGDHAFYNCGKLDSFTVPSAVVRIGDYAFAGCKSMKKINLCGGVIQANDGTVIDLTATALTTLGYNVFQNCSELEGVEFPDMYAEDDLLITMWNGCSKLGYIKINNPAVNFVDSTGSAGMDFENFKYQVSNAFYFEGYKPSSLYNTAKEHSIAFKYYDQDIYEITVPDGNSKNVYQVNSSNQLIDAQIDNGSENIVLPETIGPYKITRINSGSFQNKCSIKKVTIPSSIETIDAEAFKGCHNLGTVIFTEPVNISAIGERAFKTQDYDEAATHVAGCSGVNPNNATKLIFVGPLEADCVPFQYAMNKTSNINSGTQNYDYILYQGGWPANLEVKYNRSTDQAELVGYPTLKALKDGKYNKTDYPYMTDAYISSAMSAADKYIAYLLDPVTADSLTEYESDIINATIDIVLPSGIQGIKKNLFKEGETADKGIGLPANRLKKTITASGLKKVGDEDFAGCDNLVAINLEGTESIGNHSFKDCTNLRTVNIPASVASMGKRPFVGCGSGLTEVNFSGSPYFTCENSIIYKLNPETGEKVAIVECLEGKSSPLVTKEETMGVSELYPEAFQGTDVVNVDLSETQIETIPANSFADTRSLTQLSLPNTVKSIEDDAFKNSAIRILKIPGMSQNIGNNAFSGTTNMRGMTFYCEEGSGAAYYAKQNNIAYAFEVPATEYKVSFYDKEGNLLETVTVTEEGAAAKPPAAPEVEGYEFTGWLPTKYLSVTEDIPYVQAQYEKKDIVIIKHKVTFLNEDDSVWAEQMVEDGQDVIMPKDPTKEGYTFKGWKGNLTNIVRDETVFAYFEKNVTADSDNGNGGNSGNGSGNTNGNNNSSGNNGNNNNSSSNGNSSGNNSNNGTGTATLYTLTVQNGSGSGSYAEGSQPIIIANDPASGQEFSHWTIDPATTKIASNVLTASVITMPAGNVTVTAHYKVKSTSGGGSTGTGNSSSTVTRPTTGTNTVNGSGTTVVIDKNGLSNTGVVSVVIGGSSDNFTVKISESTSATEAGLRALMNEYGNDLTNVKYFPMDISLYDASGTKKITDTSGLSINITLPIPDALRPYAGNNKVASVVNEKLEKITPKFTTIDGVPCITFKAEHFSPYLIYVDTTRLSEGTIPDTTPKTGDGIHPKWFLAIALACMSMVMFLQKDNRKKIKVKASK